MIFDRESKNLDLMEENFYKRINCSDIMGINGYCDDQAIKIIRKRISEFPLKGIHFIGSNNYHYISKLWIDRIKIPFSLVLFDYHSDMQGGLIEGLLSCGNWLKFLLDNNNYLQKVFLIGTSYDSMCHIEEKYSKRCSFFPAYDIGNKKKWKIFVDENIRGSLYVSIDKDVLNSEYAITGWNHGKMNLLELKECLLDVYSKANVLGTDVCGDIQKNENVSELMRMQKIDQVTNMFLIKTISDLSAN